MPRTLQYVVVEIRMQMPQRTGVKVCVAMAQHTVCCRAHVFSGCRWL